MVWWWDISRHKRAGSSRAGFEPTVPSAPPSTGYLDSGRSRYEVCPPALLDDDFDSPRAGVRSLIPPLTSIRNWFQTGWYSTEQSSQRPSVVTVAHSRADRQLAAARASFVSALDDVHTEAAVELRNRARGAHTLRELWHLRNPLFTTVSIGHCESVARERLGNLNLHFPIREQRSLGRAMPHRAPNASDPSQA